MTARILVVDDVPSNVKLLEARLLAEYFDVATAMGGEEALAICARGNIDVIVLDVMMPDLDGFEVCRRLKADPKTQHIPVVLVTALDKTSDRIRGLEAGADDFLSKPVNELQLISRVRSLARLKTLGDELRLRTATSENAGFEHFLGRRASERLDMQRVLLIDEDSQSSAGICNMLAGTFEVEVEDDPQAGFFRAAEGGYECILVSTAFSNYDPLRLCSQLRALDRTRLVPIILVADADEEERISRALEMAVNDYVVREVDPQELIARLRTQLRRKRYNDLLRASVTESIELAVTDPLTGLHNRRFLESHLQTLFDRAVTRMRPLSMMMMDIDAFKQINDRWGHDGGDGVLREFADRLRRNIRGNDLICRYGGEEFVIIMPDTDLSVAGHVAERVRAYIAAEPFVVNGGIDAIPVTASVGVAELKAGQESAGDLMKRADLALYEAKTGGRNRVVAQAA